MVQQIHNPNKNTLLSCITIWVQSYDFVGQPIGKTIAQQGGA